MSFAAKQPTTSERQATVSASEKVVRRCKFNQQSHLVWIVNYCYYGNYGGFEAIQNLINGGMEGC